MPFGQGPGPRRLIPITQKNTIEFRFIGGKLNVEPTGSEIVWASCVIKEGAVKMSEPKTMTRSLGTIGGVVTFQVAKPIKFSVPCTEDLNKMARNRTKVRQST